MGQSAAPGRQYRYSAALGRQRLHRRQLAGPSAQLGRHRCRERVEHRREHRGHRREPATVPAHHPDAAAEQAQRRCHLHRHRRRQRTPRRGNGSAENAGSRPVNRKNAVSIAALLALLAFSVVAIGRQGVRWLPPADQRHAVLEVTDANGIATGSKLLLRGVPIGQVTAVRAAAERVEIEFGYRRNYRIPIDSDFRIESLSSLGESYVAVLPKSTAGPYFADDQHIRAQASTVPRTFGDLSAALTRMLNGIRPETMNSVVGELDSALPADIALVHNLSRASVLLASNLLMNTGSIRDLLTDGQDVLARSNAVGPTIAETSEPARMLGINFATLA
ncbi:MCE family protein [Nocardia seriolae]|nr:MCE family protein [Nocardia seriolae]